MIAAAAGLWGLAEATVFFIVADVWISFVALRRGWRSGLAAAIFACAGALIGGAFMYRWGASDPEAARHWLDLIPAISPALIGDVRRSLADHGLLSLVEGAFTGIPFKIYAVEAGATQQGLAAFLLMAIPARLIRFAAAAFIAAAAAHYLRRHIGQRALLGLFAAVWVVFYAWYFSVMSA
jgi:membrane protein YqaA with SNARE-associated domain